MKLLFFFCLLLASMGFGQNPMPDSTDFFRGKYRRVPKTTQAAAPQIETFPTLFDLWQTMPDDSLVSRNFPPNRRLPEENRNVCVQKAWILAANWSQDNDFHLFLGDGPLADTAFLLVAEVSGLPDEEAESYPILKEARRLFLQGMGLFPDHKAKFFRPESRLKPVPVKLCGSLFFDGHHDEHKLGYLRSQTSWEIHPVTWIEFLEE